MKEQRFQVTANLESALRHLRHEDDFRTMWIDAICINQSDTEERTQQVAMMAEIYYNAARVLIWLADLKYLLNPQVLTFVDALVEEIKQLTGLGHDELLDSHDVEILRRKLSESMRPSENLDEGWRTRYQAMAIALSHFFSLPWFRRIWVLQEVFYSSSSTWIRYGEWRMQWEFVVLASAWQRQAVYRYRDLSMDSVHMLFLLPLWERIMSPGKLQGLKILDVLVLARGFYASDTRDKIYALLSLAGDTDQVNNLPPNMRPDYAKPAVQVYTRFTRGWIDQNRSLDIISLVDFYTRPGYSPCFDFVNLPTWVPNFYEAQFTERILGQVRGFRASAQSRVIVHPSTLEESLCIQGIHFDKVAGVLPTEFPHSYDKVDDVVTHLLLEVVRALWLFTVENVATPYPTGEDILEAYLKTLICNTDRFDKYEDPPQALDTDLLATPVSQPIHYHDVSPSSRSPDSNPDSSTQSLAPIDQADLPRSISARPGYTGSEILFADFAASWHTFDPSFSSLPPSYQSLLQAIAPYGSSFDFGVLVGSFCLKRTFFVTAKGYLGLGPHLTQIGGHVVLLAGGKVPFILRTGIDKSESGAEAGTEAKEPWFYFIGECYVHGIMDGSAWEEAERNRDEFPLRVFDIR
ncbi:hypothetical protein W97_03688 [Coniosporium apollinis CBS 100218]|uniref:Heterokaryon incompatibility domain-containing protein n=1 Tax=Coniosporium apollinis (strain CBS 100218) TaxID=1168221 RepID=R7YRB7_CONA1|nr:uncharacterized protein W97_03688 [Coniosporium apollinis CBS 100218]EON64457.1 hypothetical protein W97_03688 [Coniosporium apollinis CBS 100218]